MTELDKAFEENAHHKLKILPEYFTDVINKKKTFEVRFNDRDFKVGDIVKLCEYIPDKGYTGRSVFVKITYILDDKNYCKDGFVVF